MRYFSFIMLVGCAITLGKAVFFLFNKPVLIASDYALMGLIFLIFGLSTHKSVK